MKNRLRISLFVVCLLSFFYLLTRNSKDNRAASSPVKLRKLSSVKEDEVKSSSSSEASTSSATTAGTKYDDVFANNLPAPLGDEAWSHKITFEDDAYVSTLLTIGPRSLDTYVYRWRKENGSLVLVAGELPKPEKVEGTFPTEAKKNELIGALNKNGLDAFEVLKSQEVWDLSYDNVLRPKLKTEVQYTRLGRNYHENWYLDTETGEVTQVRSINRN